MESKPSIPIEFNTLFSFCAEHGYSPMSCIGPDHSPEAVIPPNRTPIESVFTERMPLIFSDIASFQRRDIESRPAIKRLFFEATRKTLSIESLLWLDKQGYDLTWLFFNTGKMLKGGYKPAQCLNQDGTLTRLGCEQVKLMRSRSNGWKGLDWGWLHGNRFMRKREIAPSMAIITRAVICWEIPPFYPCTPDVQSICNRVQELAKCVDTDTWGNKKDWHLYVIKRLQKTCARAGMLIGFSPVATSAYLSKATKPTDCACKAFLILDYILSRYGKDGLLNLLEMLNEDAVSRGYENLGEVFKKRSWTAYKNREHTSQTENLDKLMTTVDALTNPGEAGALEEYLTNAREDDGFEYDEESGTRFFRGKKKRILN